MCLDCCAFDAESGRTENGHRVDNDNNHDEDEINTTGFHGPTLPVTCGSVSGILHRSRFATGLFLTDDCLMTGIVECIYVTLDHRTSNLDLFLLS